MSESKIVMNDNVVGVNVNKEYSDLISIVVPVYNVEAYLIRCVDSIINQTYQNLEIILVDDGSTDNSGLICDSVASKDKRIRVIHQKNGGLSAARNAGIEVASGKYLGFVDSDDYIDLNMYQSMIDKIYSDKADIVICDCILEELNGSVQEYEALPNVVMSQNEVLKHLDGYTYHSYWKYVTAWNKLYNRVLFDSLRYPNGKIHEDEYIIHKLYEKCNVVSVMENKFYHYIQRPNSITTMNILSKLKASFGAFRDRIDFFELRNDKHMIRATLKMMYLQYRDLDRKLLHEDLKEECLWIIKRLILCMDARGIKLLVKYIF